ncbi:class I SAM-dependent methyltransferase [Brachybacterium sp. p3-SID1565]|uniref:Class I SAM-dependent methyltransferase n=1 Tax=Brachybacterium epidermidis TaxID=2781983 RepID=A0ABR9VZ21_9MICO|nr:class I SAM-dependent methyltransferase [Brachybacterium sp. p3-SID1565]MBE9403434.1 class I SAM-dependent methyltransferase [Brachybacterium epidermidis]MCT1385430.1 class I SAM-dependent methyltransferase [Brachybacterium sp. p3-SID1565]
MPAGPAPTVPPVSSRHQPRFRSAERKEALAAAFQDQGEDYDRLRPGYPGAVVEAILTHLPDTDDDGSAAGADGGARAVDLGAGTGKLAWALAERGLDVTAVDTSAAMLETARRRGPSAPSLTTHLAPAESTGLPEGMAHLVTAAQAWHWFDAPAATIEVTRLLAPGGVLALVWNTLDVAIPWVHRLSRIMHAGDVQREDFEPAVGPELALIERRVHRWEDPMPSHDVIDLARTRSYVITAAAERRNRVLANLDWYLHEHLGHARGSIIGVPYRTDLFLYRAAVP